jgi:hypothetical protein
MDEPTDLTDEGWVARAFAKAWQRDLAPLYYLEPCPQTLEGHVAEELLRLWTRWEEPWCH